MCVDNFDIPYKSDKIILSLIIPLLKRGFQTKTSEVRTGREIRNEFIKTIYASNTQHSINNDYTEYYTSKIKM